MAGERILVAEDEADVREVVTTVLDMAGYEVDVATEGPDVLTAVKRRRPDLIVLDLMLPKMDGLKVCRFIKFDGRLRDIPVIIYTARGGEHLEAQVKEVGAEALVSKTEPTRVLVERIRALLDARVGGAPA